jgi:hypothetical protein
MKKLAIILLVLAFVSCKKEVIEDPVETTKELRYEITGGNFSVSYLNKDGAYITLENINSFTKTIVFPVGFESRILIVCQTSQVNLKVFIDNKIIFEDINSFISFNYRI